MKHVRKVIKHVRKAIKPYENTSHPFLENIFFFFLEKDFFCSLIVYQDIVEAFFKRKAPEANASFCVFESQCPKIMVLSKALKAKLSLILSEVASLLMLDLEKQSGGKPPCCRGPSFNHPLWQCSCTYAGPIRGPFLEMMVIGYACVQCVWHGLHGLRVLSLLVEEGRSTFGIVAGIQAKF